MLYEQLRSGELNPGKIAGAFSEQEEQRKVAQIFNTELAVTGKAEQAKAVRETIGKLVNRVMERKAKEMTAAELTTQERLAAQMEMVEAKKRLEKLKTVHISL